MMSKRFFVVSLIIVGLILNCFSFYAQGEPTNIINDSIIIDSLQVYRDLGFDISKIDNPILYEKECLVEGNLPFVVKFNNPSVFNVNEKSSLLSSIEKDKLGFGSINYKYMVLLSYEKILKMPVYKKIFYNNFDKINKTWNNGSYEIIDFYKDVVDTRYHWVETKDINSLSIPKNGFLVVNIVGCFKPHLGNRNIDVIPSITINGVTSSFPSMAWWSSSWNYRKTITINHSQVPSNLTNFPVLIDITDTNLRDYAQDDGDDIAFINSTDVQLNHEIELFNGTSGRLVAWVNVTRLSSTIDTVIYMYYNNSVAINQEDVVNTWDSYYLHVWHMNGSSTEYDSKMLKNNGNVTGADIISGKIGFGRGFIGANSDYINYGDLTYPAEGVLATATFEFCLYHDNAYQSEILDKYLSAQYSYMVRMPNTEKLAFSMYSNTLTNYWTYASTNALNVNSKWVHLAVSVEATGETCIMYLNGSSVAVTKTENGGTGPVAFPASTTNDYTGRLSATTPQYSTMSIDELRVSKIQRSIGWISTGSNNIRNSTSGGFYIIGSQETSNYLPVISNEHPVNKSINQPLSLTWNCTITHNGGVFNWSIDCSNGQSISMNSASNGSKSLPLTGLNYFVNYTVWVNATDGIGWTNKTFWFKTMSRCPVIGNISENLSIWYCVNLSDDYGSITKYNISLFNGSQYVSYSGVTVGNKTVCVLFSNLSYNITYIVNISVFDGFCYTNSSDTFNISLGGDLNMMLADISIEPTQLFLFIVLSLWLFFISHYLNKRRHETNNFILGLSIFLLSIPLSINLMFIAMSFIFGYVLVFLIPLISLVFLVDSIFNK